LSDVALNDQTLIQNTLFYVAETWELRKDNIRKLEAFEI